MEPRLGKEGVRMKALIINASPKKNGSTATALDLLEKRLKERYEVERVEASDLAIRPCVGCSACRPDGRCVLPRDGAHEVGEKIAGADLLVFGSPCYWGNIPSTLKAIFDRNVTTFERFVGGLPQGKLGGKKALVLVTTGSPFPFSRMKNQGGGTVGAIKTVLKSSGVKLIGVAHFDSAWNMNARMDATRKTIDRLRIK